MSRAQAMRNLEGEVTTLLYRVRRAATEQAHLVHPQLQVAAYPVLLHVAAHAPTRAADVVEHLGLDKGAVSRQVGVLERLGLVRRTCDPEDRRAQTLVLTEAGRAGVDRLATQRRSDLARRLATWSVDDLDGLTAQLARFNESLEG